MTENNAATMIRPLVAGNWKMNGLTAALAEADAVASFVEEAADALGCDVMICPPATLLAPLAARAGAVLVGGQDCHVAPSGAHTGDLSAEMIADSGASAVIVGHSERRADHGETDRKVREKTEAAHRAGLTAIVCIGETIGQRDAGLTLTVLARQLAASIPDSASPANTVVAYEPVWAIGTGVTPTVADVAEVHEALRQHLVTRYGEAGNGIRLLYGGSVKPSNAAELMAVPDVNGALVGGASLKAADFTGIIGVYRSAKAGTAA